MQVNGTNAVNGSQPQHEDGKSVSREEQLALMLDLFSAQMDAAVQEADESVEVLTRAFDGLLKCNPDAVTSEELAGHTRDAVMAMQFYDRLSQRLGHVRYSLSTLALFMCDPLRSTQSAAWERLRGTVRKLYSSEEERALFELMLAGKSPEEAREHAADRQRAANENRIELF